MKRHIWVLSVGLVVMVGLSAFLIPLSKREIVITEALDQFLSYRHFQPHQINDEFSDKVFRMYLDRMDLNKRYFLQSDIEKLDDYQYSIDEEWKSRNFKLFEVSSDLLEKRLLETKDYFTDILSQPFDLTIHETFETDSDKQKFAKTKAELKEIWRKSLKLQVMMRVANTIRSQEEAAKKSDTVSIKSTEQLEAEARKGVLDNYNDWHLRVRQMDREDRWSIFINSVISVYDPHSMYMPPRDQERFNVAMAGKYEGIGATLRQKDGYLMVVDMFPGSPSWRSKKIEINDMIMMVAQGEDPFVDILDMKQEKAVELIKGPKETKVRLSIRKRDGSISEVELIRDIIIMEESYAGSLILEDSQKQHKIGYIYLPQFYLDFQDKNGRKSAEDVNKEIQKLSKEGVDGLMLDLRNNGGGSLAEAIKMAGLFIQKGPIVQVKARDGAPQILKDEDPRIQYDGPLIVMTNYSSASASEIFAGAIQDYHRGVVVGSPSTWGKGSVQRVADLDAFIPARYNDVKPLGALSLTIQKYYRINGETTQLRGVTPDIVLPDSYQQMDIGEKEQVYALGWDRIAKASFTPWDSAPSTDALIKTSNKRVEADPEFDLVRENAQRLKRESGVTLYTLNLKQYLKELKRKAAEGKKYQKLMKDPTGLVISAPKIDERLLTQDTARKEISDRMIEDLSKDIYLEEAVNVMKDMIRK